MSMFHALIPLPLRPRNTTGKGLLIFADGNTGRGVGHAQTQLTEYGTLVAFDDATYKPGCMGDVARGGFAYLKPLVRENVLMGVTLVGSPTTDSDLELSREQDRVRPQRRPSPPALVQAATTGHRRPMTSSLTPRGSTLW